MTPQFRALVPSWYREPRRPLNVIERAARQFNSTPAEIKGPYRAHAVCRARWAVMLAMSRNGISTMEIGRRLDRDHSTIIHGVRRAEAMLTSDADFADKFARVAA